MAITRKLNPRPPVARTVKAITIDPADRPTLVRVMRLRYARTSYHMKLRKMNRLKGGGSAWNSLEITIPKEICEVTGIGAGVSLCMEAYGDGRIRMYPAGDVLNAEDASI